MTSDDYDHLYKVVLVGDAKVGKTHLLSQYVKGSLPKAPTPTIGVEFATRTVTLAVGGTVKAQIWDTAGQERYRAITSAHYRRAVGALLVYDVTDRSTYSNCSKLLAELRENAEPGIVIMLVGNKLDSAEKSPSDRQVPRDAAAEFARQSGLLFAEASAVTAFNVKHVFEHLLQEIYNQSSKGKGREGDAQAFGTITIKFEKDPSDKLGLSVEVDKLGLKVNGVKEGCIKKWNEANPNKMVETGDMLIEVNGTKGNAEEMLKQFKSASSVELVVQKEVPPDNMVEDATFEITLTKEDGAKLGLDVQSKGTALWIRKVLEDGLVGEWNAKRPSMAVKPGDRITKCNGKGGKPEVIVSELKSATELRLTIATTRDRQGAPKPPAKAGGVPVGHGAPSAAGDREVAELSDREKLLRCAREAAALLPAREPEAGGEEERALKERMEALGVRFGMEITQKALMGAYILAEEKKGKGKGKGKLKEAPEEFQDVADLVQQGAEELAELATKLAAMHEVTPGESEAARLSDREKLLQCAREVAALLPAREPESGGEEERALKKRMDALEERFGKEIIQKAFLCACVLAEEKKGKGKGKGKLKEAPEELQDVADLVQQGAEELVELARKLVAMYEVTPQEAPSAEQPPTAAPQQPAAAPPAAAAQQTAAAAAAPQQLARPAEEGKAGATGEAPRPPPAGSATAAARGLRANAAEEARRRLEQDIDQLWADAKLSESSRALALEWCDENGVVALSEILENKEEFVEPLQLKKMEQKRLEKQLIKLGDEMLEEAESEDDDDVKYSVIQLVFGHPAEVARGTEALLGITTQDRISGEEKGLDAIREEIKSAGTEKDCDNLQYILHGVAQEESSLPPHVIEDYKAGRYHGGLIEPGDYDHGHAGMSFKSFMEQEEAKLAGLSEPELCSIRLYTTSSFPLFNRPLRQGTKPHPLAMTVYFLINGIKKLRAVAASKPGFQDEKRLYRGMKNADLDMVKFKAEGGAEFAAMSTTPTKDVAHSYSQSKRPLLFMFLAKGMSKGVEISWCSVYPKENEVLYPPGTFLRYVKDKRDPDGTKIVQIEPQIP